MPAESPSFAPSAIGLCLLLALWPAPAFAYIDAGVGSMIVQLLIGGVAGLLVVLRLYWHRVKRAFSLLGPRRRADRPPGDLADDA